MAGFLLLTLIPWTGGWVPSCANNTELVYNEGNTQWKCETQGAAESVTMNVDFYQLDTTTTGDVWAGFQINKSELEKWKDAHPNVNTLTGDENSNIGPVQVQAECWQGKIGNMPSITWKSTYVEANYTGGEALVVPAKIPVRDNVENPTRYSCIYGIQQETYTGSSFFQPFETTELYYGGTELSETETTGTTSTTGYITQGANTTFRDAPVLTRNNTISVPEYSTDFPYFEEFDSVKTSQGWIYAHYRFGETLTTQPTQIWNHFFTGSLSIPPRHPGSYYCEEIAQSAPACN